MHESHIQSKLFNQVFFISLIEGWMLSLSMSHLTNGDQCVGNTRKTCVSYVPGTILNTLQILTTTLKVCPISMLSLKWWNWSREKVSVACPCPTAGSQWDGILCFSHHNIPLQKSQVLSISALYPFSDLRKVTQCSKLHVPFLWDIRLAVPTLQAIAGEAKDMSR